MSIKSNYQTYGILTSNKPDINLLKQAISNFKVKSVLSLDRDAGAEVQKLIEKYKLPLQQTIHHIEPNSPAESGRFVFNNISNLTSNKPVLIHCQQGQDRTGFAVAAYLVKNGIKNAPNAIVDVEKNLGYGKGISDIAKNTLDGILGFVKPKKPSSDVLQLDDKNIVNFNGGIIEFEPTPIDTFPAAQDQTNSLSLLDYSGNENALGIRSSIRRGKLLKLAGETRYTLIDKITELLCNYSEDDLEEMLSLMRSFEDIQNADVPIVGERSNYDGVPYSSFSGPSSTPGGSSSIALVEKADPGGVVQL
jgi:rhodanese-related sulfurtransferase